MRATSAVRQWWRGVAALVVVATVIGMWTVAPGQVTANTAPTYDEAVGQLRLYMRYINERDFTRAYNLRSSGLRARVSLSTFANQFANVNQSEITVLGTAPTGDETVVYVKLVSIYADSTSRVLGGEYVMGFEGGRPRIFDARLRRSVNSTNGTIINGLLADDEDDIFVG